MYPQIFYLFYCRFARNVKMKRSYIVRVNVINFCIYIIVSSLYYYYYCFLYLVKGSTTEVFSVYFNLIFRRKKGRELFIISEHKCWNVIENWYGLGLYCGKMFLVATVFSFSLRVGEVWESYWGPFLFRCIWGSWWLDNICFIVKNSIKVLHTGADSFLMR